MMWEKVTVDGIVMDNAFYRNKMLLILTFWSCLSWIFSSFLAVVEDYTHTVYSHIKAQG